MLYLIMKWLHVLAAIIAIGTNITYGIWIARASQKAETLSFTLKGIKVIDDRVSNPAYGLLLITGVIMIFVGKIPVQSTPWLITALVLYVLLILAGALGYTPTLKRQIQVLGSKGLSSPEYQAVAGRGTRLGLLLGVLAVAIVFLMVVKPPLWG